MEDTNKSVTPDAKTKGSEEASVVTDKQKNSEAAVEEKKTEAVEQKDAVEAGDSSIDISTVDELTKQQNAKGDGSKASQTEDTDTAKGVSRSKKKKHSSRKAKKIRRWVITLVILGLAIFIGGKYLGYSAQKVLNMVKSGTQVDMIERMDLAKTISTTGTIQSKDVRTLTSALSGVTIEEVNYEVGDMVEKGAVVVAFSREDINKKIEDLQEDINEASANRALTSDYKATEHMYDYGTADYNNYTAGVKTTQAAEDLAKAQADLSDACADKSDYASKIEVYRSELPGLKEKLYYETVGYDTWQRGEQSKQQSAASQEYDYAYWTAYYAAQEAWQTKIKDLQTKINEYESEIKTSESQLASYDQKIENARNSLTNAQRMYDSSATTQVETARVQSNNLVTSDYNYARDSLTSGDTVTNLERQMEEYVERLDDYVVYAPITGMVTSVNAEEGNGYQATSGALMTIQAVDSYEVTTQIDEYDIPNVKVGQRVVIMTDATGDEELEGSVRFISPTATAGQSGNTYEVDIDILTSHENIKLGMSAKLNIILESHDNVLAVRYDAIEEEDGKNVIYIVDDETAAKMQHKSDKKADSQTEDGIMVFGPDGGNAGSGNKSGSKASSEDEQTFWQYLFAPKKSSEEVEAELKGPAASAKKVVVNVGIEGDYYTEVMSDEITEGQSILVNSTSGQLQNFDFSMFYGPGGGAGGPDM